MMGPNKRTNRRINKTITEDSDNYAFVKHTGVTDLTSTKVESYDKPKTSLLSAKPRSKSKRATEAESEETGGMGTSVRLETKLCLQNDTKQGKETEPRIKPNNVPSTSTEVRTHKETDQNESLIDEDLLLDSQFSSQDNLLLDSSQDGDICEVRWDYTSPKTMKQLKKTRGKYTAQDVKRIIANFPDVPVKPVQTSVHQYCYTIAPKNIDAFPRGENKIQKAKRQREAKRLQRRERCKGVVEDMILILQKHQEKQGKNEAETCDFKLSAEKDAAVQEPVPKSTKAVDSPSDDDLFQDDNSFLIEATQNLEKILPMITNNPNDKQSPTSNPHSSVDQSDVFNTNSCDMFSSILPSQSSEHSLSSKSVIPPSFMGTLEKKLFKSASRPLPNNTTNKFALQSGSSSKALNTVDCIETKPSGHDGLDNVIDRQQSRNKLQEQRTNFARHTFQDKQSLIRHSRTSLSSPLRKCLSFDDSLNSTRKDNVPEVKKGTLAKKQSNSPNISFDSSLTDELLLQASEVLDSACEQTDVAQNNSSNSLNNNITLQCAPSIPVSKPGCSNTTHRDINITNTLLSPVRSLKQEVSMKRVQRTKVSNSPMQTFFKKTFAIDNHQAVKHKSMTGPHSTSTPVKQAKTIGRGDEASTDKSQVKSELDGFMDDDSFMNDEAMFESQILPILKLAETQVTEKECKLPSNQTKYSPDEIEKKRQAALQKLRKNDSVHFPPGNVPKVISPDIVEKSQISSSPRKCSQEEIDRKKRAAQRKLLAKTNSAGSIQSSSCNTTMVPHNSNRDTLVRNEIKCTQEAIRIKREEALKKRRLRLMQLPNRKS